MWSDPLEANEVPQEFDQLLKNDNVQRHGFPQTSDVAVQPEIIDPGMIELATRP